MQGYNPGLYGQHHVVAHYSGSVHEHGSPPESDEEGGYLVDPEQHKIDPGVDDDLNAALTSQTLNADGTPKRPMNAFMIFARRRRPQVAAENQSMRTGDVSKILSREWNEMSLSEKQFYLDQAKILKDNFNQKYPDYVYKRRPNNSRKRRKPDPTPAPSSGQASTSDLTDEYAGSGDFSDVSPVEVADMDDPHLGGQDVRYASLPADPSGETYSSAHSRASSYQPPDVPFRPLGDTRVSYMSRTGRATPDTAMGSSVPSVARGSDSHGAIYYHPYLSAQQHHHHAQPPSYFQESGSTGEAWTAARDDQSRVQIQPWPQNSQAVDDRHRGYPQAGSSHAWTNTSASEGIPSSSSVTASTATFNFPTLNSPFYPAQTGAQEVFPPSSVPPISVQPQHYGAVASIPGNPVSGRPYSSLQQAFSSTSSSTVGSYQQQARTIPLTHPSGQPVSSYLQTQSTNTSPSAGSGGDSSQLRYWSRER